MEKQNLNQFYFNINKKGGVGKSLLCNIQGFKYDEDENVLFIDVDKSTRTLVKQLAFLKERKPVSIVTIDLLNEHQRLIRDKLLLEFEIFAKEFPYTDYYFDFGSTESEELCNLLDIDLRPENLKIFEQTLRVEFNFNVVLSGISSAYIFSTDYLKHLCKTLDGMFRVNIYINNKAFFITNLSLIDEEVIRFAQNPNNRINSVISYGNIDGESETGKNLLDGMKTGKARNDFGVIVHLKINDLIA